MEHFDIGQSNLDFVGQISNLSKAAYLVPIPKSYGSGIVMVPVDGQLSTQFAADLLNVRHDYFLKLLEEGKLSFERTPFHKTVKAGEFFEFKRNLDEKRKTDLDELAELDSELI